MKGRRHSKTKDNRTHEDKDFNPEETRSVEPSPNVGVVFLEARLRDDFKGNHDEILHEILAVLTSRATKDLFLTLWEEILKSEAFKGLFSSQLFSLKAVEYVGEKLSCASIPIRKVSTEVHVYQMSRGLELLADDGTLLQGEIIQLPSLRFEGIWDLLVFDKDIRSNLIRMMTNMLKFSRALAKSSQRARMNRLILLSGPPGTGKTTLSQALAQKLSIRLNRLYSETKLIQINAATLLSKFFSESAKCILQIFSTIDKMCQDNPKQFICVLIDEIESLAASRTTASSRGEVQDTIRATNALLTGFDRVKSQPNLIILCTSNMIETLDAAFTDRCGHQIAMEAPSLAARYQILRHGLHELITASIITTCASVLSYRDAQLALLTEPKQPSSMLIRLCQLLDPPLSQSAGTSGRCSARFLGQLPEVALADRLVAETCTLEEALEHMMTFVKAHFAAGLDQSRASDSNPMVGEKRKLADVHWDLGVVAE